MLLLSLMSTDLETGYYATGFAVISVLIAIPALDGRVQRCRCSRVPRATTASGSSYVLERLIEVTLIVGVGLGIGLAFGAGFIVQVLSGKSGTAGDGAADRVDRGAHAVPRAPWQYGLLALHRHRALLVISAAGLAASVIVSVVLIPVLRRARRRDRLLGGRVARRRLAA